MTDPTATKGAAPPPNLAEPSLRAPRDAAASNPAVSDERVRELRDDHRHNMCRCKSESGCGIQQTADALDELLRLRAAASAEGAADQWVSVDERLPEREGYYLVVWRNANQHVRSDYFNGFTFPYDELGRTTHWRPLPPPPAALAQAQPDGGEGER